MGLSAFKASLVSVASPVSKNTWYLFPGQGFPEKPGLLSLDLLPLDLLPSTPTHWDSRHVSLYHALAWHS